MFVDCNDVIWYHVFLEGFGFGSMLDPPSSILPGAPKFPWSAPAHDSQAILLLHISLDAYILFNAFITQGYAF